MTGTSQPSRSRERGEPLGIVDQIKRRNALAAAQPGLERDLAADPGRLAHRQGERKRHAASHPDIDIGGAPQVAQVPPRHRIEPLPHQAIRRSRRASPLSAPGGRFSADHDHADAVLLHDRLRCLSDRQSADHDVAHFGRYAGRRAILPSLDSCGAFSLPIFSSRRTVLGGGRARFAPRRSAVRSAASFACGGSGKTTCTRS